MTAKEILTKINNVTSDEALELIENKIRTSERFISLGFLNQHGFNLIASNLDTQKYFSDIDILLRDGIGIKIANKMFSIKSSENLNGTDLIPKIIQKSKQLNVDYFVFGTTKPWLEKGTQELLGEPNSAKLLDGFKAIEEYLAFLKENIDENRINIIILAMGMPKQEQLAHAIKNFIDSKGIIICGGAIIDFKAGKISRAPAIFRKLSLEWFYRLIREPRRLFKRYIIGIPLFFINLYRFKK